jgi:putative mRNA 3-end processing factor
VLTTHGRSDDLVRYLREHEGIDARALTTLYGDEDD